MMPVSGGASVGTNAVPDTTLAPPYAISYEVGAGIDANKLAQGGRGSSATSATATQEFNNSIQNTQTTKMSGTAQTFDVMLNGGAATMTNALSNSVIAAANSLNSVFGDTGHYKVELPGGTREMWALFNRETRVCHYCTSTVTKDCKSSRKKGFMGIGNKTKLDCTESEPVEKCEDIPM